MDLPPPITDVPADKVGEVVQDFIDNDGVTALTVKEKSDGTFVVTPTRA